MRAIVPLKRVAQVVAGQSPPSEAVSDLDWSELPFLQGNAEFGPLHPIPRLQCESAPKRARCGDVLLSVRAPVGALNIADRPYGIGRGLCAIRPAHDLHPMYTWWVAVAMAPQLGAVATGSTYDAVTAEDVGALPIPLPDMASQRAIADYLDRETERIDALIAAKRRMVELMEERRRVEISQLTSESARDATTTATTSSWYPRVPAHWRLATVGQITRMIADGPHVSPDYTDENGIPFLSVRNVVAPDWDFPSAKYISAENFEAMSRKVRPLAGDVLLTKGGTTGVARVVDIHISFQVWVHVAVLKLRSELVLADYLAAALNGYIGRAQSELGTRGATNQDLALGRIARIEIALPPLPEQRSITAALSGGQASHDATESVLQRHIDLLRERRHALITAAVTGQIDIPEAA